jgi:hypothetical protein
VIKGTAPDFQELDTVDVKKKLFTREEFRSAGRHTVLDHDNLNKAPKPPSTKPLCDDSGD